MKISYLKKHTDKTTEELLPHRYKDGLYRVEIKVSKKEMEEWAKKGANVRMSGPKTSPSIVPPKVET